MERKTAAVIFGGQSSEHEVSCMSAANVIDRINKEKYDLLLIGITMDGHWIKTDSVDDIRSGEMERYLQPSFRMLLKNVRSLWMETK